MVDLLKRLKGEPKNDRREHGFIDSADVLSKPIKNIIPLAPTTIPRLVERQIPEANSMALYRAQAFPLIIDREGNKSMVECAVVINHPLQRGQILHLYNNFGHFKRELHSRDQIKAWRAVVSDDWCELAEGSTVPTDIGNTSEVQNLLALHMKINGFPQFRPHLLNFINALGDSETMLDYSIPFQKKNILLPVLYFNLGRGKILWHDEVLLPAYNEIMLDALEQSSGPIDSDIRKSLVLDTFAGMATLFYFYPELANSWNPKHGNQELSLAQKPVEVWRNIKSVNNTLFMRNLVRHIARNSRI